MSLLGQANLKRIIALEHKVQLLMATWQDIKNDVQDLKTEVAALIADVDAVQAKLVAALAKPQIDPADIDAVHGDLTAATAAIKAKLHADTM